MLRFSRFLVVLCAFSILAEAQIEKTLASLYTNKNYRETAISPDGKRLAWVEALRAKDNSESANSAIYLLDLGSASASPVKISAGGQQACAEQGLAWSPDSRQLAFLSDCATKGQRQIYTVAATGSSPHKLTSLTGFLQNVRWSPDGKRLAVLFTENAVRAAIKIVPGNHLVAGQQQFHHRVSSAHAARKSKSVFGIFQCG